MEVEIEAKWLNINAKRLRDKLKEIGAVMESPERLMARRNFDFSGDTLQKVGGWVRVRDEGNKITMSYKQLNDRTLHGTQEVTIIVGDFQAACAFLESIGLRQVSEVPVWLAEKKK